MLLPRIHFGLMGEEQTLRAELSPLYSNQYELFTDSTLSLRSISKLFQEGVGHNQILH